ncbi:cytochrome d ubiquinol oxidase subunit II [Xaviernesmea oryzae]|uniref:Cytochrome d ubiquinol oxidase subunit II n=1 Tax=Xaviernesmea oryzae TaxID=464029 RepID=A0A1Q9AXL5_9HYPH|nr:cytochrome d ubiquinol oxidase subunit II [Xaviernesmea oryzae]OLP60171.1 cytochrome d ubiquinol oxidase subunit II [Xaviernesmea oryzae]SEK30559.1 cytochrome d ubiquinol oxidase subunit II [Xaviernesmea oryzae]
MTQLPLDYETLRLVWWLLLGVLLIGFAVMDGFDLGIGALLPFAARTDEERRTLINLVGPTWEGNQVWLILGGGAIFAAWPALYAVSFSGFYLAMITILLALILRPVGFKFRGKIADPRWRAVWDWALFIGGFVPALIFGVAVGNVLLGVPFGLDGTLRPFYTGSFFGLLRPFALLSGLISVAMLVAHGAAVIALRTEGAVAERAATYGRLAAMAAFVLFALAGLWVAFLLPGYVVTSAQDAFGPSNPLSKTVTLADGGWLSNYAAHPWMIAAPVLGLGGSILATLTIGRAGLLALASTTLAITGIIATAGLSLFPFLLPSSLNPSVSLTVWDASSSHMTLFIMLVSTVIFLPLILAYTTWVYRVMRGPVTPASIGRNPNAY